MNTVTCSALMSSAVLAITSLPSQADNHLPAPMQFAPAELMVCEYMDGKGPQDLRRLTAAFSAWVAEYDKDYSYWMVWPEFHEDDSEWDVGLLGAWTTGAGFGAGYDAWASDRGDVGDTFAEVLDCNNTMAAVTPILVPQEAMSWDRGTLWFQRCTRADGVQLGDAVAAHRRASMAIAELGETAASWAFVPVLGAGDPDFDYYHVQSWGSHSAMGAAFDAYFNNGGWMGVTAALGDRMNCATPNLYAWRLMHGGLSQTGN
ncbi:MAG: hypothetical protein AAGA95_03930 [Pseudomonadota bacterium]